jgi:hypothetical protein
MRNRDPNSTTKLHLVAADHAPLTITEKLNRLIAHVRVGCPEDTKVSFHFDGQLRINIDVRNYEDIARIETLLPKMCEGIFSKLERRSAENHPFFHRLSGLVSL